MNIVKLKDILMPEEFRIAEFFNTRLKGKYAYWVQMRYIFPLDSLDYKTYIHYEQLDTVLMMGPEILPHLDLYEEECCMVDFVNAYIDITETERVNGINEFALANEYVVDSDLDSNKLRLFRSWLASELLFFNTSIDGQELGNYSSEQVHMLEYYKNGLYNDIVKHLSIFGRDVIIEWNDNTKTCGSCKAASDNLLSLSGIITCDALEIYKKNLHKHMVATFRQIDFWMQFNKKFIKLFKQYIDNIIRIGLVINNTNTIVISSCECMTTDNYSNEKILRSLSTALQYIHDDDIIGHKNIIQDALYNWAEYLYEYMSWEIK